MKRWWLAMGLSAAVIFGTPVHAAKITLQFVPQEKTGAPAPALPGFLRTQGVKVEFEDARAQKSVGSLADDDDRAIPLQATGSVAKFAGEVLERTARQWGVKGDKCGCLVLQAKLTRFYVKEKDWPFSSFYKANAGVSYVLKDALGRTLASGNVSGDASRYGASQSTENCNEVLSDALKEAYARLLDRRSLDVVALKVGAESAKKQPTISPSHLLSDLRKLKAEGSGTELLAGYARQRQVEPALTTEDISRWKAAGMPEAVIVAAMQSAN